MIGGRYHIPGCEDTLSGGAESRDARILRTTTACDIVRAYAEGDGVWTYQDIFSEAGRVASTVFQLQLVRLPFAVLQAASLRLPARI